jgi:Family of unknown function (DUF6311)
MEPWLAPERQTLSALAVILALALVVGWRRRSSPAGLVAGAALGVIFFVWIAGVRVITPTEASWTLKLDWMWHFLGWHFFRQEPWHLPPGRIDGYLVPLGTSIGFTDSIPLAALLLKPVASVLPMPFQYLGGWLALCFALQGFFGALLARLWSPHVLVQLLAAACFVLLPTLLGRVGHVALCSHWLLLWTIWLYLRTDRAPERSPWRQAAAIGALAGLIHPYLAAMTLLLLGALAMRLLLAARIFGIARATLAAAATIVAPALLVAAGWWASGLFLVSGVGNLASIGLGRFSMNLLAVITPSGWSILLPEWPVATDGQAFEGFQYLGVGLLALLTLAASVRAVSRRPRLGVWWPLVLVCAALAVYALSPRVTFGGSVIADVQIPWLEHASMFRSTGRFFWPAAYLLITTALATLIIRIRTRYLVPLLAAAVVLQLVDLRAAHAFRRRTSHDPAFFSWVHPLTSPAWHAALPHYDHLVLYPPPHCGIPPAPFEAAAYFAAMHGLTINGGLVARMDNAARIPSCHALSRTVFGGEFDASSIYLIDPMHLGALRKGAQRPIVCGVLDGVGVCVTADSYASWRDAATLE